MSIPAKADTIQSVSQIKHFSILVDDSSCQFGSGTHFETPEGQIILISIQNGLSCIEIYPPTELDSTQISFTSDMPWDTQVLDDEHYVQDIEFR
jgi:hypothetical protein